MDSPSLRAQVGDNVDDPKDWPAAKVGVKRHCRCRILQERTSTRLHPVKVHWTACSSQKLILSQPLLVMLYG